MRGYPGFDLNRFITMMLNVFWPLTDDFLRGGDDGLSPNGACITNYWTSSACGPWRRCHPESSSGGIALVRQQ
ncbi:hypothetical protein [Kribbella sp. NPDC050470]